MTSEPAAAPLRVSGVLIPVANVLPRKQRFTQAEWRRLAGFYGVGVNVPNA